MRREDEQAEEGGPQAEWTAFCSNRLCWYLVNKQVEGCNNHCHIPAVDSLVPFSASLPCTDSSVACKQQT